MKEAMEQLKKLNFNTLTPIQEQTMSIFDSSNNIVGLAPTGTGKTLAYLLPIIKRLDIQDHSVQAVILVPTNELVIQVTRMLKQLDDRFIVKSYYGGLDKKRETTWLTKQQPQIVIATPEKVLDFTVTSNVLKIHHAKYLVLDEADMMFDEKFLTLLDPIITVMEKAKLLLYSASLSENMEPFIGRYFGRYKMIDTRKLHQLKIEQRLLKLKSANRLEMYGKLLKTLNPFLCIVFVSKKDDMQQVYEETIKYSTSVLKLDTTQPMRARKKMLDDIFDLKYQYVIATDLASRGLDFSASHIINYDLPYHLEYFTHRSGRTGRMNQDGIVITLVENRDSRKIDTLKARGNNFVDYRIVKNEMKIEVKRNKGLLSSEEMNAIKSIKKPKRATPNSRKKNNELVQKALKEARNSGKKRRKNR